MFKFTRKQKDLAKKVLTIALAFACIIAVISLFTGFGEDENGYKTITPSYSVGDIDKSTGKVVKEEECALYTKDVIECTGIKLYADFDGDITYTVHFYDENDVWLSCEDNEGLNLAIEDFPEGTFGVRIVIYPQSDENGKIGLLERSTYANQLTVKTTDKVSKN